MPKNFGVKLGRRHSDFVAGALPYFERLADGNWKPYLPPGEWQWKNGKDTMACVTFSLLNCLETQEFHQTGQRINYSDRWIAMMSDTQPDGNYLYLVADAVRKYGLVREESWPAPATFDWPTYYAKPSAAKMKQLLAEGQEWLKNHSFAYEWINVISDAELKKQLKRSPLQVVIPGHAIEGFYEETEITRFFDSYEPFEKQTPRFNLSDVLIPLLTVTNMNQTKVVLGKDGKTVYEATPIAIDIAIYKKQAAVEGIEVPNPIPPASSL